MTRTNAKFLPFAAGSLLLAVSTAAQCATPGSWTALGTSTAPTGSVHAMVAWDPDGPGPLGEHVVCGGEFQFAGSVAVANVTLYDPVNKTWAAIGVGLDDAVLALAVLANGDLVAGGDFLQSGGASVQHVARWNGTAWVPVGAGGSIGTNGTVAAMAVLPTGDLVVGGEFSLAGGVPSNNIARFTGAAWAPLGAGITGTPPPPLPLPPTSVPVASLDVQSNGNLVVGGLFATAGTTSAAGLAAWTGSSWISLGNPLTNFVGAMRVLGNDDVVITSWNAQLGNCLRRWDGATWSSLDNSLSEYTALYELANGTLLVGVLDYFTAFANVHEWTGTSLIPYSQPTYVGPITAMHETAPNDVLLGQLLRSRGVPSIARRDNGMIVPVANGLDGWVEDAVAVPNGVVIGGRFSQVDSSPARGVALLQNGVWSTLGGGVDGDVFDVAVGPNGDVLIAGIPDDTGSVLANGVARWDGSQWQALGTPPFPTAAVHVTPAGEVLALGGLPSQLASWDGVAWTVLGTVPDPSAYFGQMVSLPNGDLVVASASGSTSLFWRWDGSAWSQLGSGTTTGWFMFCNALHLHSNGDIYAGGQFVLAGSTQLVNLARFDGTNWTPVSALAMSPVNDIAELPNGDLLITQDSFDVNGMPVTTPTRLAGTTLSPIAGIEVAAQQAVGQIVVRDSGDFLVFGSFEAVQGTAAGGIAVYATGCPALLATVGAGCAGSAGPVTTDVVSRAWLGGAFVARTSGMPSPSLAVEVYGLSPISLPLVSVIPQALPGCNLYVSTDVLLLAVPQAGVVTSTFVIPATTSLLAQSFRHQVIPVELTGAGAITAVSSSDALLLTIGSW